MSLCSFLNYVADLCIEPATIPLNFLGVVDVAASNIQETELLTHALANVSQTDKSHGWAVKHSSDCVNEYPRLDKDGVRCDGTTENPNHLLGSFPCLFPYGLGGFEVYRPLSISYESHARWALRYEDKRFRKDYHFMFQVFGVLQKRQVCAAATLQISKPVFLRHEREIRSLRSCDFEAASAEENAHKPFTNPFMRSLRQNVSTIRAKVMGTDESRIKIRSFIWGMCVLKNPPSIWLTINPADIQDPVAQVLCGEDFDLDNFDAFDLQPSATAIAADPFAATTFFHLTVKAVLQHLFGITGFDNKGSIQRETGILGDVEAYIGTVEAQGRGTLHLHMLLWLRGSKTSKDMKDALSSSEFRDSIKSFIGQNIHADFPDIHGADISALPRQSKVAFSRPIDPRKPNYDYEAREAEKRIARTVQLHRCGPACMQMVNDRFMCKRRAPFALAEEDWIDENGDWGPRRTNGYLNSWNPSVLQCLRANHDIKLITNGKETKHIAWYVTHYATKKRKNSSNTSALLAKKFAFRTDQSTTTLTAINKKLIQQCANTLSREQELSAPEVVSYLMGWGDRYISHHFETIHWYLVTALLKQTYPILQTHP